MVTALIDELVFVPTLHQIQLIDLIGKTEYRTVQVIQPLPDDSGTDESLRITRICNNDIVLVTGSIASVGRALDCHIIHDPDIDLIHLDSIGAEFTGTPNGIVSAEDLTELEDPGPDFSRAVGIRNREDYIFGNGLRDEPEGLGCIAVIEVLRIAGSSETVGEITIIGKRTTAVSLLLKVDRSTEITRCILAGNVGFLRQSPFHPVGLGRRIRIENAGAITHQTGNRNGFDSDVILCIIVLDRKLHCREGVLENNGGTFGEVVPMVALIRCMRK